MHADGTRTLPDTSFAELAFELRVLCRRELGHINNFEFFMATLPVESPGLEDTLKNLRQSAALIDAAQTVLSMFASREREVRALFGETEPAPAIIEEAAKCGLEDWKARLRAAAKACWQAIV